MDTLSEPMIDWGIAARALAGQRLSGDRYLVKRLGCRTLLAVVDGLGHGREAAAAAQRAVATLEGHASESVTALVERCHETTRGTRGVVIGVAVIDGVEQTLSWMGVGNVEGVIVSPADAQGRRREIVLLLRAGIVGAQLPRLAASIVPLSPGDLLILHTDGIRADVSWPTTVAESAQRMAERILAAYGSAKDDALVLVSRYLGGEARST